VQLLDDIQTRECRAFAKAWQNWRGGETVPRRADVRLEDIGRLLQLVSVIEVVSQELARFRIAGTALCEALGFELTGLNFFDFATPEARAPGIARTHQVAGQPCGSHYLLSITYSSGRTVPTEIVSFPVWPDDPSAPPQIFGLSMALEEMRLEGPASESNQLFRGEGFRFIDIGAGVPDPALKLAERPPASLLP